MPGISPNFLRHIAPGARKIVAQGVSPGKFAAQAAKPRWGETRHCLPYRAAPTGLVR